jgi:hypothetical protein
MNFDLEDMKLDIPNRKIEIGKVSGNVNMSELIGLGIISIFVIILIGGGLIPRRSAV